MPRHASAPARPGQGGGLGRAVHDVGATTQRTPSASTAAGQVGVGLVDHQRAGDGGVEAGHADHRRLVAELGQQPVGRALEGGAGDDRATPRPRRPGGPASAARTPGTASIGPMDTIGFDGRRSRPVGAGEGVEHARAPGRAGSTPAKRTPVDGHGVAAAHEVLLEADLALAVAR